MASKTRVVMLGTGDFAVPTFELLLGQPDLEVVALVTQPDRPQGRKQELIPSRIKLSARARNIPVLQPEDVNAPEGVAAVKTLEPDFLVTAAYGQILSAELLGVPKVGAINLHGSILPAYRGAAPVARAIERGETETGATVIHMTPRIDAGGMIAIVRTPIGPDETAGELEERISILGAPTVAESIRALLNGSATPIPQSRAKVTRAPKLRKEDGLIDWSKPAQEIHNLVRAMQPWPGAYTFVLGNKGTEEEPWRVLVRQTRVEEGEAGAAPGSIVEAEGDRIIVAAGKGRVRLLNVQIAGRKALTPVEFIRGYAHLLINSTFLNGPTSPR